ncbi:MAG TPA: family 16 glycosylhydrolase, partial [Cyclobacteriaceae bacterium]|nr:family 16 glycosylhydrolase [Cyclobacteriaceae bacterium]
DEFEGTGFDTSKWFPNNPTWKGRQPAFFSKNNVAQSDGRLNLTMRREDPPEGLKSDGYHTFTTAAVRSRYKVKYGYFEVKAKAMNSKGGSAFWFFDQTKSLWTEIDVFEICGKGERENQYNMAAHVFYTPLQKEHWARGDEWRAPYRFADDFHVFGLEWTPYVIRWYVDGDSVRTLENTHWHQPLTMNFDSETYPDWFGLPDEKDLPSTYSIEYVRSWRYKSADWMGEGSWGKNNID